MVLFALKHASAQSIRLACIQILIVATSMLPFVFRAPPLHADTDVYHEPHWSDQFRHLLSQAQRPVKVISPCAGLNAPERAAREMQMPWQSLGDYEINEDLATTLERLSQDKSSLHVGRVRGDVLQVSIDSLSLEADGLISGPPCPPFSTIGKRLIDLDCRSAVFLTICAWIIHLASKGSLSFFVLENVIGILKRKKGEPESFAVWFVREILHQLPGGWDVSVVQHNSCLCMLPQSRPRCFFVGTSAAMRATAFQRRVLQAPLPEMPRVDILDFLDKTSCDADWDALSIRQQMNLLQHLDEFKSTGSPSSVGVIDVARDPNKTIDSTVSHGCTRTLRTNCSHLWLVPGEELKAVFGERGRKVNRHEKCRFAGLVPSSCADLTDAQLEKAVGHHPSFSCRSGSFSSVQGLVPCRQTSCRFAC